jgi:hypothetical protein
MIVVNEVAPQLLSFNDCAQAIAPRLTDALVVGRNVQQPK